MMPVSRIDGGYAGAVMKIWSMCLGGAAGRDAHPDAQAVVVGVAQDARTASRSPSFAGCTSATISGFITKPPAAMMTDFALIAPVSENCFHVTPATAPDSSMISVGGAGLVADLHAQARRRV